MAPQGARRAIGGNPKGEGVLWGLPTSAKRQVAREEKRNGVALARSGVEIIGRKGVETRICNVSKQVTLIFEGTRRGVRGVSDGVEVTEAMRVRGYKCGRSERLALLIVLYREHICMLSEDVGSCLRVGGKSSIEAYWPPQKHICTSGGRAWIAESRSPRNPGAKTTGSGLTGHPGQLEGWKSRLAACPGRQRVLPACHSW